MQGTLRFENITKRFGAFTAVDGVTLDIEHGMTFSLLGPSGCGKTTLLRMAAGFEKPDQGRVLLDGKDITDLPPEQRPVNTVFQNYALFPHLTIRENIAFGLRISQDRKTGSPGGGPHARPRGPHRTRGQDALQTLRRTGTTRRHRPRAGQPARGCCC